MPKENGERQNQNDMNCTTFAAMLHARWQESNNVRWSVIAVAVLILITSIFISFGGSSPPPPVRRIDMECRSPRPIQPWRTRSFRPKWFGFMGGPKSLTLRTKGRKAHQVSIVAIDKRDIEIRVWVDKQDLGYKAVEIDDSVDCGDDAARCILMGFASARVLVPPGNHVVKAEIVNDNRTFQWGFERQRRVKWLVDECLWS